LCTHSAHRFPLKSRAFATGRQPPARRGDAVLQRYHSTRRHPGGSVSRIPLKVSLQSIFLKCAILNRQLPPELAHPNRCAFTSRSPYGR
jgi:hypothetical protein